MEQKAVSHFKILEKLGEGGMGIVYKAHDTKLDRVVALKFLPFHLTKSEQDKARFLQEARAAAALNHPNVCTIYEIQEHKGQQFIVMEYVEGKTLKDGLSEGLLDLKKTMDHAIQIAEALKAAHSKGIVHRDIKSENIMITETGQVKVMDFGLAKLRGSVKLTKTSTTLGTVAYMSPEHIQGKEIDTRTDIFSFGVVLYEMLTGQLPFKGDYDSAMMYSIVNEEPTPVQEYRSDLSSEYLHILDRVLEKDPADRYQSINDMLIELKRLKRDTDRVKRVIEKPVEMESRYENHGIQTKGRGKIFPIVVSVFIVIIILAFFVFRPFKRKLPPWLSDKSILEQITSDPGYEMGVISPDGRYLAYLRMEDYLLHILDIQTGSDILFQPTVKTFSDPSWSPNSNTIAVAEWDDDKGYICIYDILGKRINRYEQNHYTQFPRWSPDGNWVAFMDVLIDTFNLVIMNMEGVGKTLKFDRIPSCPTWDPDSKHIVFVLGPRDAALGTLHILDVGTGSINELAPPTYAKWLPWSKGGLAWSPCGKYIVYTSNYENNPELLASKINVKRGKLKQPAIPIHQYFGECEPFWPSFTHDGSKLCYGKNEDNGDIYISTFDENGLRISGEFIPVAINRKFDSDPSWTPDGKRVLFISERDNGNDIYQYDLDTRETIRITNTPSIIKHHPQLSPDGKYFSFVADNSIWGIPTRGGETIRLIPEPLKVKRYQSYAWTIDSKYIYTSYSTRKSSFYESLVRVEIQTGEYTTISEDLFMADIHISPNDQLLALASIFYDTSDAGQSQIRVYDIHSGKLIKTFADSEIVPKGDISWTKDSKYILNDYYDENNFLEYKLLPIWDGIPKTISVKDVQNRYNGYLLMKRRNPLNNQILFEVWYEEADIWMIRGN